MKLKLFLLSIAFFCLSVVNAQPTPNALVFEMKDGTSVSFLYEDQPKLKFTETDIVINTSSYETSYPQSAVQKYIFAFVNHDSINIPENEGNQIQVKEDCILINHLKPGTIVQLISMDGKVLTTDCADTNGNCTIFLYSLPTGIYLLNYYDTSIKILKP